MAKNKFTQEQIDKLRLNPYTYSVNENTLRYTKEFKEEFWRRLQDGDRTKKILTDLGYDVEILGKSRMISIYNQVKEEAASPEGFRDYGTRIRSQKSPNAGKYDGIPENLVMQRMQTDLIHMRQELDFLKKVLSLNNTEDK